MVADDFIDTGICTRMATDRMPEVFQVIGERGSGTNLARRVIGMNTELTHTEVLGWKHAFPSMLAVPDNLLTVVCLRDARNWALSMHDRPWHAHPVMHGLSFSEFIRAEWQSHVDRVSHFPNVPDGMEARGLPLQYDRHPLTGLPFPNLFALRTAKLQGHLSMLARGGTVTVLRMEILQQSPERILDHLSTVLGVTRKPGDLRMPGRRLGTRFRSPVADRPLPPDMMSADDLAFMAAELDLTLERKLGYAY